MDMDRSEDWMDEAEWDLAHAKNDLKTGFYNWGFRKCRYPRLPLLWHQDHTILLEVCLQPSDNIVSLGPSGRISA